MKRRNFLLTDVFFSNGFFRISMTVFEVFVVGKGAQVRNLCDLKAQLVTEVNILDFSLFITLCMRVFCLSSNGNFKGF